MLVAAVALQRHPGTDRQRQRQTCEQHRLRVGVEGLGDLAEQRPDDVGRHGGDDLPTVGDDPDRRGTLRGAEPGDRPCPAAERRADGLRLLPGEQPVEIVEEHLPRHRVDGEVVHGQQQRAAVQGRGDHPAGARIEQPGRVVAVADGSGAGRADVQDAVPEPGPQHVVMIEEPGQRIANALRRRGEPEPHRLVVAVDRAAGVHQRAHDRRQRQLAPALGRIPGYGGQVAGRRGQRLDRAQAEYLPRGQGQPGGAGPSDQRDRDDAVAAQRDEVGIGRHVVEAEEVTDDPGDQLLPRGLRRPPLGRTFGGRQRRPVELPVRRDGEGVERYEERRHHHLGQRGHGRDPYVVDRSAAGHVAHQLRGAPIGAHDDRRARHAGHRGEHGLDLAQLDAVAADLDLEVGAAQVLDGPVGAAAGDVAGAVHRARRHGAATNRSAVSPGRPR